METNIRNQNYYNQTGKMQSTAINKTRQDQHEQTEI
jgi:hypothetical protein